MTQTPIQQAIEALTDFYARGDVLGYSNTELSRIRSCITKVESLLPKEKDFINKVWGAAIKRTWAEYRSEVSSDTPDNQQFINQLYPEK